MSRPLWAAMVTGSVNSLWKDAGHKTSKRLLRRMEGVGVAGSRVGCTLNHTGQRAGVDPGQGVQPKRGMWRDFGEWGSLKTWKTVSVGYQKPNAAILSSYTCINVNSFCNNHYIMQYFMKDDYRFMKNDTYRNLYLQKALQNPRSWSIQSTRLMIWSSQ